MKTCPKCKTEKPETEFYKTNRGSGIQSRCKVCMRAENKEWIARNPEKRLIRERRRRALNPGASTAYVRKWRAANPQKYAASSAASDVKRERDRNRYANNPARKASVDRRARECARRNPEREWAKTARRRTTMLRAAVAWADEAKIKAMYLQAKRLTAETGIPHQVDHIVPLRGKLVRGLHWEGNLQVLPRLENIRKSNKLTEAAYG